MNRRGLPLLLILLAALLLCIMCACRSRERVVTERIIELHTDTVLRADSVLVRDSIYVFVGDTVVRERWRTEERVKWREITRTDTVCRVDSVFVHQQTENTPQRVFRWFWVIPVLLALWLCRKQIIAFFGRLRTSLLGSG